ncbi:MAG: hypothetical protein GXO00_02610, partial [Candidatus Diapherotrites archaeon]|nr:hypothetical protein [Candidatus Diapherotrites archaeon]
RLFTALTMHLLRYGWSSEQISSLIGEVYEINNNPGWTSRVRSFKVLANALGKKGHGDLAVSLFLDDFGYLPEAERVLLSYKKEMARAVQLSRKLVEDLGHFAFVDARGRIPYYATGVVASVLSSELGKPVVVIVEDGEFLKGSIRGGKNLSQLVERLLTRIPGEGGGHMEAAGFRIRKESLEDLKAFLSLEKL